jgi:hypothetical protein
VLVAACLAALLVIASLVIDIGGARHAKTKDQNSADAIALAGAAKIDPTGSNSQAACTAAWNYMVTNSGVSATPAPSCLPFAGTCVATTARQVVTTQGDFQVTFENPVPDTDPFFADRAVETADGTACQRFGVTITHTWRYLLQRGSTTLTTSAVALFVHGPGDVDAPLVILDPHACESLTLAGNSQVTMQTSNGSAGYIAIDSDGSLCTSGNKVVLDTTGTSQITAGGIAMWALANGNSAQAYDPADVGPGKAINPVPVADSAPVGRTAINNVYNCIPSNGCPGAGPSAINTLVAADGSGTPSGFTRWSSTYPCNLTGDVIVPRGNWYIDCGSSGLSTSANLTFRGGDIVSDGPINLSGGGWLRNNCDAGSSATACPSNPASPSTIFIRSGALSKSGGVGVTMLETFVYLANGGIDFSGNGALTWTAPEDPTYPFNNLLVWFASNAPLKLTGNTATDIEGIFYAPGSAATISGTSNANGLGVQMFVGTAALSGDLVLKPSTDRVLQLGGAGSALIR